MEPGSAIPEEGAAGVGCTGSGGANVLLPTGKRRKPKKWGK